MVAAYQDLYMALRFAGFLSAMDFRLHSVAFRDNQEIPMRYTGEGEDISPPLRWSNLPAGTRELALICEDPDAPQAEPWVHWLLYKIPVSASDHLQEHTPHDQQLTSPAGALQGMNSFGRLGYGGPMPPVGHGWHHYHFHLYALKAPLSLEAGATKDELLRAMKGLILGQADLTGIYKRGPDKDARL